MHNSSFMIHTRPMLVGLMVLSALGTAGIAARGQQAPAVPPRSASNVAPGRNGSPATPVDAPTSLPRRSVFWGRPSAPPADSGLRRVRLFQEPTPPPPTLTPESAVPGGVGPSEPNLPDLSVPAADRGLGGGSPTDETLATEAAEEEADPNKPKLLQDILGFGDSPVKIYGWIQNSFTGNTNGRGNGFNFGVNPNFKANEWMGNQYYLIVENPLEQSDEINFGFRFDNLFGNDWQFNYMQGLFNNAFEPGRLGYDLAQMYGEVHIPDGVFGTKGLDVKGGRFYTIAGYEQVPAIARPLLSVPYMFNYGQPFTHTGVLTTWHLTDKINLYNGAINGWDRWINERYTWGYIGGFSWTGNEDKTTLAFTAVWGPNQFPSFLPTNQTITPNGYINIPSLAGQPNPGYTHNDRTLFTTVLTHKWDDKLTQVLETDQGFESNVPGLASRIVDGAVQNGAAKSAQWQSFGNWFLYNFNDKLTGVWRSEVFWDQQGGRTGDTVEIGLTRDRRFVGDRFYEQTLGLIYKPIPNLWIRPEARYDWAQYHPIYSAGTRKDQFTLGFDVILLY